VYSSILNNNRLRPLQANHPVTLPCSKKSWIFPQFSLVRFLLLSFIKRTWFFSELITLLFAPASFQLLNQWTDFHQVWYERSANLCHRIFYNFLITDKAIPVRGHGGPLGCETSRLPHFIDNRLTDVGEVVSLTRRPAALYTQEDSGYSFLLETESIPGP
jgi:hypothetical protein